MPSHTGVIIGPLCNDTLNPRIKRCDPFQTDPSLGTCTSAPDIGSFTHTSTATTTTRVDL